MLNTKKLFSKIMDKLPTFLVETRQVSNVTIAANNVVENTLSVSKSGYTTLGVVGHNVEGSGASYLFCYHLYTIGNTLYYAFRNDNSAARSGMKFTFYVLYLKFGS